jgi:hypothetical protein
VNRLERPKERLEARSAHKLAKQSLHTCTKDSARRGGAGDMVDSAVVDVFMLPLSCTQAQMPDERARRARLARSTRISGACAATSRQR